MRSINSAILASASLLALGASPAFAQTVPAAPANETPQKQAENAQVPPNSLPPNCIPPGSVPAPGQNAPYCPAPAERTNAEGQPQQGGQAIVVTGSRIRRDNFSTPQNVDIVTRSDTILAGTRSTAETLQQASITSGTAQINGSFLGYVSEGGEAANTVGLRGLGSSRTLVLLNGRRLSPAGVGNQLISADLNVLPNAVVQRIEVLREGASSIYGSDAIAGVINIITDTSVNGLTLDGFADAPLAGGGETIRGSATWGKTFSRGHIMVSAEYREFAGLRADQRKQYRCPRDLFFQNGKEVGQIDPSTGQLRCFPFEFDGLGIASGYGIYYNLNAGELGRITFPGYDTGNPTFGPPVVVNDMNLRPPPSAAQLHGHIISPLRTWTGYANGSYDLDALGNAELYGEALFTRRDSNQDYPVQINIDPKQLTPAIQDWGGTAFGYTIDQLFGLSPQGTSYASPFFPTAWANAGVNYFVPFIIPARQSFQKQRVNYFRGNAGLRGDTGIGDWRYDANLMMARTRSTEDVWNINSEKFGNSLVAVPAPAGTPSSAITMGLPGQAGAGIAYTCASNVTNGAYNGGTCAPFDYFNPAALLGGQIPDNVYNYIFQHNINHTKFDEDTAQIVVDGSFFELPGGMLKGAFGLEHRHDYIKDVPSEAALNGQLYNRASAGITEGSDVVNEAFGELDAPILRDRPFFHLLEVDGSLRYTDYRSYGSGWTYHINGQWAPVSVLRLRGNYGTNFRAPNLYEQFVASQTGFYGGGADPCSEFGTNAAPGSNRYNNCLAALTPILGQAGALNYLATNSIQVTTTGGKGNLGAEHAKTWGFGAVLTAPRRLADFSLAVDYWNIKVKDEVGILGTSILSLCYDSPDFPNNRYCDLIAPRAGAGTAHPGSLVSFLNPYINISGQQATGIDIDARYATNFLGGHFQTQLQATRNLHQKFQVFAGETNYDYNGTPGYPGFGAGPKWVATLDTRFTTPNHITFRWGVKYVGKQSALKIARDNHDLTNGQVDLNGIGLVDFDITAEAYWEHGVSVQWEWPNLGEFTVGVNNIFNEKPPTFGGFPTSSGQYFRLGNEFGGGSYDYLGRSVFVNVTRKF